MHRLRGSMLAVFDESGDTGQSERSSRYLVIAGVVCDSLNPVRGLVTQARKRLRKKRRQTQELKGRTVPRIVSAQVLAGLALLDVEIYVAILDKQVSPQFDDCEEAYRITYVACVRAILAHYPNLVIVSDQRYNKPAQRRDFISAIAQMAQQPSQKLIIQMADSQRERAIQVADTVAWGFFQKYEHGNETFSQVMTTKLQAEVLVHQ